MDKGELVPDKVVIGLIQERLNRMTPRRVIYLTASPRNTAQAETLDKMLKDLVMPLDSALSIDVPKDDLMKRLTGRRTCKKCQQMYNVYFSPPKRWCV